jgi:hypothetical protein
VVGCGHSRNQEETTASSPAVNAPAPTTTIAPSPSPSPSNTPTSFGSPSPLPPSIPQVPATPRSSPTPLKTPSSIAAISKSLYPSPTPIPIKINPPPAENKAIDKYNQDNPFSKLIAPANPEQRITPNGIGSAKIGMKFGELKQQLGSGFAFPVKTAFIPDFDAIAVTKGGVVQYYIPYPAGTNFSDDDRIQHLMTDNPNYRTEKGVGPGTPIIQAEGAYGSATLTFSRDNESGEFVSFTQTPQGLAFRPKPVKDNTFAGKYPESNDDYLKTQKYDLKAAIGQITVSCIEDRCGQQ